MFGYIFRTGTYFLIWKKFKKQIITLGVSAISIFLILSIYTDMLTVLKIANKDDVVLLMVLKYVLIVAIIVYNYFSFTRVKVPDTIEKTDIKSFFISENKATIDDKQTSKNHQNIISKSKLKTKTDLILEKYKNKAT